MTTIRIPFSTIQHEVSEGIYEMRPCGIDITPEIRAKILGDVVDRIAGIEKRQSAMDDECLGDFEKRIGSLECDLRQHAHNVDGDSTDGIYNLGGAPTCKQSLQVDQPAGDDAAVVTGICRTRRLARQCGMEQSHSVNAALDQMAHEVWCESQKEIADLRAKLAATKTCYEARIEKEQEDAAHWKQEYDGAMAANGRLAAERDTALAAKRAAGVEVE